MTKKIFTTGINGQIGSYLAKDLLENSPDAVVHGMVRRSSTINTGRIDDLYERYNGSRLFLHYGDMTDPLSIENLISTIKPDEIYNLAAQSHVRVSFDIPVYTAQCDALGELYVLESMRKHCPEARLYQASTSVTGDTKVLVKQDGIVSLVEIQSLCKPNAEKTDYSNLECLTVKNDFSISWSPVKYAFQHKASNLYQIKGSSGLDITLTGDHSVIVFDENMNFIEKRVDEIKKDEFLISFSKKQNDNSLYPTFDVNKYKNDETINKKLKQINTVKVNDDLLRVFGFYLAEGSVYVEPKKQYKTTFTFHIKEKHYTDDIRKVIKENFGIEATEQEIPEFNTRKLYISSKQFSYFLLEHFGTGSLKKVIPSWFYELPTSGFLNFMRGYLGDARITEKQLIYTSANKNLIENIAYLSKLNGLGGTIVVRYNKEHPAPKNNKKTTVIKGSWAYDLKFSCEDRNTILGTEQRKTNGNYNSDGKHLVPSELFSKYFYTDKKRITKEKAIFLLENKKSIPKKVFNFCFSDLHSIKINSIVKLKEEETTVYDLHVPETQRFIGGNSPVLLHNSEIYGGQAQEMPVDGFSETTPFHPRSPYGVAKLYAFWITKNYRESYGLFASNGLLFNSESRERGETFVTRKITMWFGNLVSERINNEDNTPIPLNKFPKLYLGNLYAVRDWGHAEDSAKAMQLILQQEKPDDYVIATGETHSVKEFIEKCIEWVNTQIDVFQYDKRHKLKLEWVGSGVDEKGLINGVPMIQVNPKYFRPAEVDILKGNAEKIKKLGWKRTYTFEALIDDMMSYDAAGAF